MISEATKARFAKEVAKYPAEHYVLIDDKLRILTAVKKAWGTRVTTVFPRQGHYARDPQTGEFYTVGLLVLTLSGTQISAMTRFGAASLPRFGLPATLGR